eukprot:UN30342
MGMTVVTHDLRYIVEGNEQIQDDHSWTEYRWDNDTIVYPWRYSYMYFDPKPVYGMISTFGDNSALCKLIGDRCIGKNEQFPEHDTCMNYMEEIPVHKAGYCPLLAGNTRSCRWLHSILTIEELRPDIHCFHLGPQM